ncbi:MAG: translation initiation factor IF-2 subunit gamma, partial [Candidatus Diapherotrites archaeon]
FKMNEIALISVGTMTAVGNVVSTRNNVLEIVLKNRAIVDKGQKAALSKKMGASWRLVAYGTSL